MSATNACPTCGARLGALARFCPQCGTRVDTEIATAQAVPAHESTRAPAVVATPDASFYGITPPIALLVLGVASLAVGLLLLLQGTAVVGAIVLVAALLVLLTFVVTERRRDVDKARERAGAFVEQLAVRADARRSVLRLRHALEEGQARRERLLRDLGAAVYDGDETGIEETRAQLRALDETIAAKEAEMSSITAEAEERVQRARLQSQPTMIEPPAPSPGDPGGPAPIPEPYPPPDEGTPPTPPTVPEPYPPPDEGTPPTPQ